jgi:AraC-like DNA-binding protein/CheY-like chemotaxis protein
MKSFNTSELGINTFFDSEAILFKYEANAKAVLHVIESNPLQGLFIKNIFSDLYHIIESADGVTGFEKAVSKNPDVIIIDVSSRYITGTTLCKKLKHDIKTNHIPVVLLTDKISDEQTLNGLESGCDDYISKALPSSILIAKIKNLINTRRILSKSFLNERELIIKDSVNTIIDQKFIKKAYQIVEENIDNPAFEVNDFAKAIGMSRAQLYRKINNISGQSVKEFIRIIRLKKAAEMLTQTSYNISEVAYRVGFSSIAYFTKSFNHFYGLPPSKYISRYNLTSNYNTANH